jgi:hypothetical protein
MYTKHDLTQTNKIEEVNIDNHRYHKTLDRLLTQAVDDIVGNGNARDELKYYIKQCYYSLRNIESDCYPIDHFYEEWDPDREHYK